MQLAVYRKSVTLTANCRLQTGNSPIIMKLLTHIPAWLKNKYFIASFAFIAWIIFFDRNDLLTQMQRNRELNDLQVSRQHYTDQIKDVRKELDQLTTNPEVLEKYARERYHMKKDNEELFLIPSESDKSQN